MRQIATAVLAGVAVSTLAACSVSSGAAPEPGAAGNPASSAQAGAAASNSGSGGKASAGPPAPYCAHAGDKAYFASVGTAHGASNTLAVLSGTVAVFVTAPRPLAPERSLMKHLLNKI